MDTIPDEVILKIQADPIKFGNTASIKELEKVIEISNNLYYNYGSSTLTDVEYDLLYDILKKRNPVCGLLTDTGHDITISEAKKIELPHYMGSMDKVKPGSKELNAFLTKYPKPYVFSDKIDGISLMIVYNKSGTSLYTRGNGCVGQDISHLTPFLRVPDLSHVFEEKTDVKEISIRGELVVYKDDFKKLGVDSNARNYVAGIISRKHIRPSDMSIIRFIAYEIVQPRHRCFEQFNIMKSMGFEVPWYLRLNMPVNETRLINMLKLRKEKSLYDIDGIIITHDDLYPANISGNPKQSKAFKMVLEEQMKETVVTKVEWNITKDKYLKPTIHIESVNIGGANIRRTSGFNAKFILDNGIGVGTRIILIRSGDVIPHIHQVLHKVEPDMPDIKSAWNETGIDLISIGDSLSKEYNVSQMDYFVKKLNIPKFGGKTISKLYDYGYTDLSLLLKMDKQDLKSKKIPGFGDKKIDIIVNGIHDAITHVPLAKIMAATNIFGRGMGETRIQLILDEIPNILELPADDTLKHRIASIHQFQHATASAFVDYLDEFRTFLKDHNNIVISESSDVSHDHGGVSHDDVEVALPPDEPIDSPLIGKKILCTGGKPTDYDLLVKKHGAIPATSVSKKLDILVVQSIIDDSDISKASTKYKKAWKWNKDGVKDIQIIDHDMFHELFT